MSPVCPLLCRLSVVCRVSVGVACAPARGLGLFTSRDHAACPIQHARNQIWTAGEPGPGRCYRTGSRTVRLFTGHIPGHGDGRETTDEFGAVRRIAEFARATRGCRVAAGGARGARARGAAGPGPETAPGFFRRDHASDTRQNNHLITFTACMPAPGEPDYHTQRPFLASCTFR